MDMPASSERQARAARNQALFRALNEKLHDVNDALSSITKTFVIACECADTTCLEMLDIAPEEYSTIRADSRRFAVLPGHVYSDVEKIVSANDTYVVVEKLALAGKLADATDPAQGDPRPS
jgi:5-bromo-4-chloroindolyl phosphate hydrolysis protein